MKTLRKRDLDEMAKTMQVIPEEGLNSIVGAYDPYDCVWHCLAYAESCGSNYDDQAAYSMAQAYYCANGMTFNSNNYGYVGNAYDIGTFASSLSTSCGSSYTIAVYQQAGGPSHAIIITSMSSTNYTYFDPQSGTRGTINSVDLANAGGYFINVK